MNERYVKKKRINRGCIPKGKRERKKIIEIKKDEGKIKWKMILLNILSHSWHDWIVAWNNGSSTSIFANEFFTFSIFFSLYLPSMPSVCHNFFTLSFIFILNKQNEERKVKERSKKWMIKMSLLVDIVLKWKYLEVF